MNDEIKEILDKLKDGNWYDELDLTGEMWIKLRWEETHLLLDYINNLREENKELKQENERLKGSIQQLKHNYNLLTTLIENGESMTQKFENGLTQKDYKSRIEKAVEYLDSHKIKLSHSFDEPDCDYWIATNPQVIIDILNGRSDE